MRYGAVSRSSVLVIGIVDPEIMTSEGMDIFRGDGATSRRVHELSNKIDLI